MPLSRISRWAASVGIVIFLTTALFSGASAAELPVVRLVKDINPGSEGSDPDAFVVLDGIAYFRAGDGSHGFELWRTDGTEAGTSLVIDLNPGPPNGFPDSITAVNGRLYFNGFDSSDFLGSKVWQSDGTAAGTILLADTYPDLSGGGTFGPPLPGNFTSLDGSTILFTALGPVDGLEPWRTDGTPAGTSEILDLHPGAQWSVPIEFTSLRTFACFAADDSVKINHDGTATFDRELFRTDGTATGTYRVKDIHPGFEPSTPTDFIRYQHRVIFRADDGIHGSELWQTDGNESGTTQVADLNPGPASSSPEELILAHLAPLPSNDSGRANVGQTLVFRADDGVHGTELFRSDGTEGGTRLIKDINPTGDSFPSAMTAFQGRVFFSADDGVHGSEPWVTDGTEEGTQLLADLNPGSLRSSPLIFKVAGGRVFFVAILPDDAHFTVRTQLWQTDGTTAGTQLVYEEPGNDFGYGIGNLTVLGDKLLFTAPNGIDADGFSTDTELFALSLR